MTIKKQWAFLLICAMAAFTGGSAAEDRCEEGSKGCKKCEAAATNSRKPCGYNPICRYYRYRSIYQHSYVQEEQGDDPAASWPGRRDGNFSDEFAR